MSEQVGNAAEAPEPSNVQDSVMDMTSDDFFESLDAQVNSANFKSKIISMRSDQCHSSSFLIPT